jgi:putative hemolysin
MSDKLIDIERIIKKKNPKLLRWLPGFVLSYLKKTLHQEEINQTLEDNREIKDADFCNLLLSKFNIKIETTGLENIPVEGGAIFVANHPLGGMDAIGIVASVAPIRQDIKFIVNDVLLHIQNLKNLFVGINKFGKNGASSFQDIAELFQSNQAIFVFPAGLVSRKIKGKVQDIEWKKTFVTQAIQTQKPIIPIFIEGQLSPFFYRLHLLRQKIGIKASIEMFYLADELFKQKGKTIRIHFGKAIPSESLKNGKSHKQIAQDIRSIVYSLPVKNN